MPSTRNAPRSPITKVAEVSIVPVVGPEVVAADIQFGDKSFVMALTDQARSTESNRAGEQPRHIGIARPVHCNGVDHVHLTASCLRGPEKFPGGIQLGDKCRRIPTGIGQRGGAQDRGAVKVSRQVGIPRAVHGHRMRHAAGTLDHIGFALAIHPLERNEGTAPAGL